MRIETEKKSIHVEFYNFTDEEVEILDSWILHGLKMGKAEIERKNVEKEYN